MLNKYLKPLVKSESGYAAFVVTLISIILVGLIVSAFAVNSRFEQKDTLANNLADQAYYAAESGINDALAVIKDKYISVNVTPPATNGCAKTDGSSPYIQGNSQILSASAEYTCLIINPTPNHITIDPLSPGQVKVYPIDTSPASVNSFKLSWEVHASNPQLLFSGCPTASGSANAGTFPKFSNWQQTTCTAGVIQMDGISQSDLNSQLGGNISGSIGNDAFRSLATSYFFIPIKTPGAPAPACSGLGTHDVVCYVQCNTAPATGLACVSPSISIPATSQYYIHLTTYYEPEQVNVAFSNGATAEPLTGAQVVVDSTGNASGQLKRLQETVCDNQFCGTNSPFGAIQSKFCVDKQFSVYPGQASNLNPAISSPPATGC